MNNKEVAPILILGLGNILLKDEGFGVHVMRELVKKDLGDKVDIIEGATIGAGILGELEDRKKVIVIDAIKTSEPAGTLFKFGYKEIKNYYCDNAMSLHQLDFIKAIELAEFMGKEIPEITIYGVQPKEISLGMELTPEIKTKISETIKLITDSLN